MVLVYQENPFANESKAPEVKIRRAAVNDIHDIYKMCLPYHSESMYGKLFTVSETAALSTFNLAVSHPDLDCFVSENEDGDMTGVSISVYGPSFFHGMEGDIEFFYVTPQARGTETARTLVQTAVTAAQERGINVLHCGCHSLSEDSGNDAKFTNLFKKFGFEVTGTNLHLILKG